MFLTRNMHGACFAGEEIPVNFFGLMPENEWFHVAMTVSGTKMGNSSYAGPRLYINGLCVSDGAVSQTASGRYKKVRDFFDAIKAVNTGNHYLGGSQFEADPDFVVLYPGLL